MPYEAALKGLSILAQGEEERSDDVTLGTDHTLISTLQGWRTNAQKVKQRRSPQLPCWGNGNSLTVHQHPNITCRTSSNRPVQPIRTQPQPTRK